MDELAELVGDGIYVTRLHYVNLVDPREGLITGMTRDGTFRIEGGRVTEPLANLRFTTSFPALAASLLGLGRDLTLVNGSDFYGERYPFGPWCRRWLRRLSPWSEPAPGPASRACRRGRWW